MSYQPDFTLTWPDVFDNPALVETSEPASLTADGIMAWGICMAGKKLCPAVHPRFGEVLVLIGKRLELKGAATYENLRDYAVEKGWLPPETEEPAAAPNSK